MNQDHGKCENCAEESIPWHGCTYILSTPPKGLFPCSAACNIGQVKVYQPSLSCTAASC